MHFEETKTNTPVTGFLLPLIIFEQLKAETLKNLTNEKKKFSGNLIMLLSLKIIFRLLDIQKLFHINPLSANPTKWSNTIKQFLSNLPANCLSVFDHF